MLSRMKHPLLAVLAVGAALGGLILEARINTSARFDGLDARLRAVEVSQGRLETQLQDTKMELSKRMDGIDSRLDAVDDRLNAVDDRFSGFDARLRKLETSHARVAERLDSIDGQLVFLRDYITGRADPPGTAQGGG